MERKVIDIDSYTFSVELNHNDSPVVGYVSVWAGSKRVGDFRVKKDGSELVPLKLEDGVVLGDISDVNRYAIIDILRNEKPLRLLYWVDGDAVAAIRIATGDEPIGEGEIQSPIRPFSI